MFVRQRFFFLHLRHGFQFRSGTDKLNSIVVEFSFRKESSNSKVKFSSLETSVVAIEFVSFGHCESRDAGYFEFNFLA